MLGFRIWPRVKGQRFLFKSIPKKVTSAANHLKTQMKGLLLFPVLISSPRTVYAVAMEDGFVDFLHIGLTSHSLDGALLRYDLIPTSHYNRTPQLKPFCIVRV